MAKRNFLWICIVLLFAQLSACSVFAKRHWSAIEGQVLDQDTGRPIEDALVIALWRGYGGYGREMCFHVETAKTDEQGTYRIPEWFNKGYRLSLQEPRVDLIAYKDGYSYWGEPDQPTQYLKKFEGNSSERIADLRNYSRLVSCIIDDDESEKALNVIDRALYEEADEVAVTMEDKMEVLYFLMMVEMYELGPEESYKRESQRVRELKRLEQENDK
ncbi:hypothetical protein DFR30_2241 [Thiogranum longum]|uniref:Carboxypeptidase family protein n=1 Tax=Thiogranum longum TaxID=1537524 RepID=A0A4R1HE83_9GAMM|nr:carboxypeptidase-like regulatory domain-containing protein [Thiogranum longum]TCK18953.1 hypothetical protein DFR30_2241 [Thiogranum longum]